MDEGEHLILTLLHKANLERKEIHAYDLLKTLLSMLRTHIHFGFLCFTFQIWLCITRSLFTVQE